MAKYEREFAGDFDAALAALHQGILAGSSSATFEDGSEFFTGEVRVACRVYERYSMAGGNRVSLSLTLVGAGQTLLLSAITSGGSQALFFKMNTLGEESFLDALVRVAQTL